MTTEKWGYPCGREGKALSEIACSLSYCYDIIDGIPNGDKTVSGITFDTHEAVKELVEAGFKKEQAEALVNFEKSKDTTQLSTKADIAELKIWVLKMMLGQTALIVTLLKLLG